MQLQIENKPRILVGLSEGGRLHRETSTSRPTPHTPETPSQTSSHPPLPPTPPQTTPTRCGRKTNVCVALGRIFGTPFFAARPRPHAAPGSHPEGREPGAARGRGRHGEGHTEKPTEGNADVQVQRVLSSFFVAAALANIEIEGEGGGRQELHLAI